MWDKADYQAMAQHLHGVDWLAMLSTNLTPNTLWAAFTEVLQEVVSKFVPTRSTAHSTNHRRHKKSYPKKVKNAQARKRYLWRQYRTCPSNLTTRQLYKRAESHCRLLIHKFEVRKENDVICSENVGTFYKYSNSRLSRKQGIGTLQRPDEAMQVQTLTE